MDARYLLGHFTFLCFEIASVCFREFTWHSLIAVADSGRVVTESRRGLGRPIVTENDKATRSLYDFLASHNSSFGIGFGGINMRPRVLLRFSILTIVVLSVVTRSYAEIKTTVEHINNTSAVAGFHFKNVPSPSRDDTASTAKVSIVDGERDPNS